MSHFSPSTKTFNNHFLSRDDCGEGGEEKEREEEEKGGRGRKGEEGRRGGRRRKIAVQRL